MRDDEILRGIRGATSVPHDTPDAIVDGTAELVTEVLERNAIEARDIVSILFTASHDLSAEFPAVAARQLGLSAVPLMCAREIPVEGSVDRCIRMLVHAYMPRERTVRHVYLHDARRLRIDLVEGEGPQTA